MRSGRSFLFLLLLLCAFRLHAAVLQIGPGQFAGLGQLNPGDVVELAPGTYHEVKRFNCHGTADQPIIIRGTGKTRPIIDATGCDTGGGGSAPRGCIQVDGTWMIIEHLELMNAHNGNNGGGFRFSGVNAADADTVMIRDCVIHDNDMGIMSDNGGHLIVDGCEVYGNGCPDFQFSHNFYVTNEIITIRGCWIHDPKRCYNVKTRGHQVELLYNLITDSTEGEVDLVDSDHTSKPNSNALLLGNVIVTRENGGYRRCVVFGGEGGGRQGTLYVVNNTFIARTGNINFFEIGTGGCNIVACNNIFSGSSNFGGGAITGANNWSLTALNGAPGGFLVGTGDPGFVNPASLDFHLNSASPCRNAGAPPPKYKDGNGAELVSTPDWMWEGLGKLVRRGVDSQIDIGAYEVGGALPKGAPKGGTVAKGTGDKSAKPSGSAASQDTPPDKPKRHSGLPLGIHP